ncbi:MAG TPA: DNA polymerase III subunit gamma/tau [Candidatus Onthocola gallistercoris]|uniref:DNA-directed DNA polymerase n=1 Tax=Candidatus Onthocola gallistercoris TaxID=2840876 RepID=A0A9D1HGH6_9FIRM|nr:DNA polymerase III subunit gamma/tau [Candidatus Onthocola gallistercoris]
MSYQALYRKWRPQTFEDVKGQDHIVTTLKNQIRLNRIGHAYLFCGTRGTGKTSVAKIFAKSVNCLDPKDGSPCGECAMCKAIQDQTSMNVIEIDAASNNGVDNIREIREEVEYSPTEGRYKVYIIDEVHMLSIGAFNALLKTLEEPPEYVIFILATTEVHKIPVTILSRCQRYDFRRISVEDLSGRLKEVIDREGLDVEEKAIRYIARAADGGMRDALSLLDQCAAFYIDQKLTYDRVLEILGAVDTEIFSRLLRAVIANDVTGCIQLLEEVITQGRELTQFVTDFTWYMRNLMMAQSTDRPEDILDVSSENLARLMEEADMVRPEVLMRYIRVFSELSGQMRYSTQKRVLLELAFVKLCKPQMERNYDSLLNRLDILERKLEQGIVVTSERRPETGGEAQQDSPGEMAQEAPLTPAQKEDVKKIVDSWQEMISELDTSAMLMLRDAKVSASGENQILLAFTKDMNKGYFDQESHRQAVEQAISRRVGKQIQIVTQMLSAENKQSGLFINPNKIHLENVVFEDEDAPF